MRHTRFFAMVFFCGLSGATCISEAPQAPAPDEIFLRPPLPIDFSINGCYTGAAVDWKTVDDGHQWTVTAADLDHYRDLAGKKQAFLLSYIAFSQSGLPYAFPKDFCHLARSRNAVPYVTWEPRDWDAADARSKTQSLLGEILSGKWDALLDSWIADVRAFGSPVLIRFAHEFNGDWYPWSGVYNGGGGRSRWINAPQADGPTTCIEAYRYVFRRFYRAGIRNVIWVWSPNFESVPNEQWNRFPNYYPGSNCVDLIALDVYNWGSSRSWSKWTSFEGIYGRFYDEVARLYPDKPIMIGEFGCSDKGGHKASWLTDCFQSIKSKYPHTKLFTYFHIDNSATENSDFRIDTPPDASRAMRAAMLDPYFVDQAIIK